MESKSGYATYRRGKLYFNEVGWAMIKGVAKRLHKSPKQIVVAALRRYARMYKNEKA
jgi:hypothetical protein